MRYIAVLILSALTLPAFSQFWHNSPVEKKGNYMYTLREALKSPTKYWQVDSVVNIDATAAFSIEVWQRLDAYSPNTEILRISCRDTITNYISIRLNGSADLMIDYVVPPNTFSIDNSNESSNVYTDRLEHIEWYHIVYTWDGSSSDSVYVNNNAATISTSGTRGDVFSPYIIKAENAYRASVVRVYGRKLTANDVATLWNDGTPLRANQADRALLQLEYTHESDTWDGTKWVIADTGPDVVNGESVGFLQADRVQVKDFEPDQRFRSHIEPGKFYTMDFSQSWSTYNFANISDKHSYLSLSLHNPAAWYSAADNKTYIAINDRPSLAGGRKAGVLVYDHGNRWTSEVDYTPVNFTPNNIDTHDGVGVIVKGDTVLLAQEITSGRNTSYISYTKNDTIDFAEADNVPGTYPQFMKLNDSIYLINRQASAIYNVIFRSSSLLSLWSPDTILIGSTSPVDAMYPFVYHHPEKLAFVSCRRIPDVSGQFRRIYFLQSGDGYTWYNIDSTFSKNANATPIDSNELESYFLVDTVEVGSQNVNFSVKTYQNGLWLMTNRDYLGSTTTVLNWRLHYSDGTTDWQSKTLPSGTEIPRAIVHVSGDTYDFWTVDESGVIHQYRTTDFFDTATEQKQLNDSSFRVDQFGVVENIEATGEVVFFGTAHTTGIRDIFWVYIYEK